MTEMDDTDLTEVIESQTNFVSGSYALVMIDKGNGEYEVSYKLQEQPVANADSSASEGGGAIPSTSSPVQTPPDEISEEGVTKYNNVDDDKVDPASESLVLTEMFQSSVSSSGEFLIESGSKPKPEIEHYDYCVGATIEQRSESGPEEQTHSPRPGEDNNVPRHSQRLKGRRCKRSGGRENLNCHKKPRQARTLKSKLASKLPSLLKLYELSCMKCSERYLIKVSQREPFLNEYLDEGVKIRCSACGVIDVSSTFSLAAGREDDNLASPMFMCSRQGHASCGISLFRSVSSLTVHRKLHHAIKVENTEEQGDANTAPSIGPKRVDRTRDATDKKQRFKCVVGSCTKAFARASLLRAHKECHKEGGKGCLCHGCLGRCFYSVVCDNCKEVHRTTMRRHNPLLVSGLDILCKRCEHVTRLAPVIQGQKQYLAASRDEVKYLCPMPDCEVTPFNTIPEMKAHTKYHSTDVVFCKHCQEPVKKQTAMRTHLTACPSLFNPSECFLCGKIHHNEFHLSEHIRRTHKKKELLCEDCGESFLNYTKWRAHKKKHHSGEVDLVCHVCGERFDDNIKWKAHRRIKHPQTIPEKKYFCSVCGNGFTWPRLLRQHMTRSHRDRDIECDICQRRFRYKRQLAMHALTHDPSKKTAQCELCQKSFRANNDLKEHMEREHRGKRDECSQCGRQFKSRQGFNLHMRKTHHNTNQGCRVEET